MDRIRDTEFVLSDISNHLDNVFKALGCLSDLVSSYPENLTLHHDDLGWLIHYAINPVARIRDEADEHWEQLIQHQIKSA